MKNRNSSFVMQAMILAVAAISTRILGFIYKLPIINLIDDVGMGLYGQGVSIHSFFYIVSSAGLPAAVSRMVSARLALNQNTNAHKVFTVSMKFATVVGILGSSVMFFGAKFFAGLIDSPDVYLSIVALAPTVIITSLLSCYRGYFQGMNNAVPTALSQIVEQVFNAVFSILLVFMLYKGGDYVKAAAGGNAGTGIGAFAGLIVIVWVYYMARGNIKNKIEKNKHTDKYEDERSILRELIKTAFPIIAGSAIFSITGIIDISMVMDRIKAGGFTPEEALALSGLLTSKFNALTTLPVTLSSAMAVAIIPSISASVVLKERKVVENKTNLALRLAMMISVPAAFGMGVFADQIYKLIFSNSAEGAYLLKVGFFMIIFLALYQITTGILQGIGQVKIPVVAALIGCIIKIPVNYYLLPIKEINILGAVLSTMVCYMVAAPINTYFAYKYTGAKIDMMGIFVKPIAASIFMSIICYTLYHTIYFIYPSNLIALLISISVGVLVYFILMIIIRGITKEDLSQMPMGNKISAMMDWIFGVKRI